MFPLFNPVPFHPHTNANSSSAAPQQVVGNPGNFAANPLQIQAQMGLINPQTFIPLANPSAHFAAANQFMNYPLAMNPMNNMSNPQPMPQFFGQGLNLGVPNQIQPDINRIFQLQMSNFNTQPVPSNLSLAQNLAFVANTRPPASLSLPQNIAFAGNDPLSFLGSNGMAQQMPNSNASNGTHTASQQLQGRSGLLQGFGAVPPSQNPKSFHPQPSKFQGNVKNGMGNHMVRNNGKSPQFKNFKRNPKHESPWNGFMKTKFDKMQNAKANFNSRNLQLRRGNSNGGERQMSGVDSATKAQVNKKRSTSLTYTEKEIQEWREERRKNYPSKANIEKKITEKMTKPEVTDKVAKLRRQQLREILAKQAELGCEVAEIPSSYLSDSEQKVHERKESGRTFSKKGNFENKFNKRGRYNQNGHFSINKGFANHDASNPNSQNDYTPKKQRLANDNSVSNYPISRREPTLLQKLLSADIRRDKHHLLQVFRFMVMNSFFNDWPERPLKFPMVMVKEMGDEDERNEGNLVEGGKDGTEGILGEIEEPIASDENNDYNRSSNEKPRGLFNSAQGTGSLGGEPQEEEGEIID